VVSIAFSELPQCSVSVWDNIDSSGSQWVKVACIYSRVIRDRISTLIKLCRHISLLYFISLENVLNFRSWFFFISVFLNKCSVNARGSNNSGAILLRNFIKRLRLCDTSFYCIK
jgi:hypothetical protein